MTLMPQQSEGAGLSIRSRRPAEALAERFAPCGRTVSRLSTPSRRPSGAARLRGLHQQTATPTPSSSSRAKALPLTPHPCPRPRRSLANPAPIGPDARRLEASPATLEEAVSAYARIAAAESDPDLAARAVQSQVRCLMRAGKNSDALRIVQSQFRDGRLARANRPQGRLIAATRSFWLSSWRGAPPILCPPCCATTATACPPRSACSS